MVYVKQSVHRPEGNPGIGIQPRDEVVLYDVNDIAFMPTTDEKLVCIEEDIVMKPGTYPTTLYLTPGTHEITSAAEGDTDQIGFKPVLKGKHPGNKQEIREFKANNINRKFIIVVRYCSGQPSDLIGSICNPCKLTPSYTGNNEGNSNEFTFEQVMKGDDIKIYKGAIASEEPVDTLETGAKTITFTADGQYQLTSGSAVIDEIEGGSHGALLTIVGTSGTAPTVAPVEGAIILRDGKVFTASEGSQLTLRAYSVGNGKFTWIEQSRYVAA